MGYSNLLYIASQIDLTAAVSWHLATNCYPPVPATMIPVCVEAIDLAICEEGDQYVELPEGVLYKGDTSAPAWNIVENFRLGAIIDANLDTDDEY